MAPAEQLSADPKGSASFEAVTNVPGITVHGKAERIQASVKLQRAAEGLTLERIEATVPVQSLSTGMGMRDEHMRKLVFTTANGQTPDIRFSGGPCQCPVAPGKQAECDVSGNLAVRGVERPFKVKMKVRHEGGQALNASGDAQLKLSDYGIERPSQLGVQTADEVKLHLDFKVRLDSAAAGGRQ